MHRIDVGKVSTRFEYFASGFASLSELTLIHVELGVEFNFESNGDIFRPGPDQKAALHPEILIFSNFFEKYTVSGFAILSELGLKMVELNSELNSASNDTIFD